MTRAEYEQEQAERVRRNQARRAMYDAIDAAWQNDRARQALEAQAIAEEMSK